MSLNKLSIVAPLALAALPLLGGCGASQSAPPPTAQEQQTSNRLDSIRKSSGGDWDKVSAADKKYLIDSIGHGSEYTAKMVFGPKTGPPAAPAGKRTGAPGPAPQ